MAMTFVQQIDAIARRIQRRRWAAAACWAFAALAAAILGLIALDWLLGVYSVVGRVVLSSLPIAALVAILRWGRGATRGHTTPLDVALELERRHPEYRSLLASGLEFSQQEGDDPTAGSIDLRRAVVLRASLAAEAIDLEAAAPRAPLRRAAVAALAAAMTLAVPAAIAPQGFATGVVRLLNPLSDAEWPRRHDLAFVDPPRLMPVGGDFQTALRDRRGALPKSVEVEYRTRRQSRWHYQSQTYAGGGDTVEIRLPNVQESFEFRARGGDHESMPWQRVETAPAPQIESIEVTAHPPAYTGLPAETAAEPIRVIAGSTLTLRGTTNLPIKSAELHADGQTSAPLVVGGDGRSFETAVAKWQPAATAEWSFSLTTPQGMTATADRGLAIEVLADQPPTVEIVEPSEDLTLLPEATIDLRVAARDDLAVEAVSIDITPDDASHGEARKIELFRGPKAPAPGERELAHALELAPLAPPAGSTWQIDAHSTDYAGQEGKSLRPLRLRVISREEFIRRIDALQSRLAAALERARAEQRQAREHVDQWLRQSQSQPAADDTLAALSRQRGAAASIEAGSDSALRLAQSLETEYRRNAWPDDQARAQAERVVAELDRVAAGPLRTIEAQLTAIARELPSNDSAAIDPLSADQSQTLAAVRVQQDEVLAELDALIQDLAQWNEVQQFQRELAEIKTEQSELLAETEQTAREALRDGAKEPSVEQKRRREQAISRQRELAARLASTLGRMRQSGAELAASKPTDAARLDAAVAQAEQTQLQNESRTAAEHLAAQRFGQAAESQRKTAAELQQMLARMSQRGGDSAEQRLAELQKAERQLETLRREVKALSAEMKKADSLTAEEKQRKLERLQLARQELAQKSQELARRLDQLRAASAAQSAQQAADQLAKRDNSQQSNQFAQRQLQDAQRQLVEERRRQQTLLSKLHIERLDAVLGRLVAAQQAVVEELLRLDALRDDKGKLGNAQQASVEQLGQRQAALREQSTTQAGQIEPFPVFARLLRAAADTMNQAETRLAVGDTGADAVRLATRAYDELKLLADAVRQQRQQQAAPPKPNQPQPSKPGGNPPPQKNDPDQVQALQLAVAQLGLLRTMQADLQQRTTELELAHANGQLDDAGLKKQSSKLAAEQRELAELAATLVQETTLPPEDNLLPDLDEELRKALGDEPHAEENE